MTTRIAFVIIALAIASCSQGSMRVEPPAEGSNRDAAIPDDVAAQMGRVGDTLGGTTVAGVTVGNPRAREGLAGSVNRHLWAASLDTLSFLPIASTDPFTGVIATDWGAAPDAPGERFKVTAYITDVALDPAALRVAVFREVLSDRGAWVPAEVAAETPRKIEDSILVRARQLRLEERTRG